MDGSGDVGDEGDDGLAIEFQRKVCSGKVTQVSGT